MGHGHPKILAAAIKAMEEGAVINLPFLLWPTSEEVA